MHGIDLVRCLGVSTWFESLLEHELGSSFCSLEGEKNKHVL